MATITDNQNGSLTVLLTQAEQDTLAILPTGQLEGYVTLWLAERGKSVLQERFETLDAQDKAAVMVTLKKHDPVRA